MGPFRPRGGNERGATMVETVIALNFAVICILMLSMNFTPKLNKNFRNVAWAMQDPCDFLSGQAGEITCVALGGGSEEGAN